MGSDQNDFMVSELRCPSLFANLSDSAAQFIARLGTKANQSSTSNRKFQMPFTEKKVLDRAAKNSPTGDS